MGTQPRWVQTPVKHISSRNSAADIISKRTQHDQPLRLLDTLIVGLRVTQRRDVDLVGGLDLVGCSVSDENGLAAPFNDDLYCVSIETPSNISLKILLHPVRHTFLPSGIASRSTSTLAMAKMSAEADMLTRNSASHASVTVHWPILRTSRGSFQLLATTNGWLGQFELSGYEP